MPMESEADSTVSRGIVESRARFHEKSPEIRQIPPIPRYRNRPWNRGIRLRDSMRFHDRDFISYSRIILMTS